MKRIPARTLPARAMNAAGRLLSLTLVFVLWSTTAHALEPVFTNAGLAIRGYDPVAYFTEGRPVEGSPTHTLEHAGATWQFASAEHRAAFAADPAAYAPQFGGYCSWAVSRNYIATTDPKAWEIVDGKLYLNFSRAVHTLWKVGKRKNIAKGNVNWPILRAADAN